VSLPSWHGAWVWGDFLRQTNYLQEGQYHI